MIKLTSGPARAVISSCCVSRGTCGGSQTTQRPEDDLIGLSPNPPRCHGVANFVQQHADQQDRVERDSVGEQTLAWVDGAKEQIGHRQSQKEGVQPDVHSPPPAEMDAPTGEITHGFAHERCCTARSPAAPSQFAVRSTKGPFSRTDPSYHWKQVESIKPPSSAAPAKAAARVPHSPQGSSAGAGRHSGGNGAADGAVRCEVRGWRGKNRRICARAAIRFCRVARL